MSDQPGGDAAPLEPTIIYHFEADTGAFRQSTEARLDPLGGLPLVPANSTLEEPPETGEREIAVWDGSAWSAQPDFRDAEYWLEDGSYHLIQQLGVEPPEEALATPPMIFIRANATRAMIGWIDQLTRQLRDGYPEDEVRSWPAKAAEAEAILAGGDAGHLITEEATITGETVQEVAVSVQAKAEVFSRILGKVSGLRRKTMAAIEAAEDIAAVEAAIEAARVEGSAAAQAEGLDIPE